MISLAIVGLVIIMIGVIALVLSIFIFNDERKNAWRVAGIVIFIVALISGSILFTSAMVEDGNKDVAYYNSLPASDNGYKYAITYGPYLYGKQWDEIIAVYADVTDCSKYGIIGNSVYSIKSSSRISELDVKADRLSEILGIYIK